MGFHKWRKKIKFKLNIKINIKMLIRTQLNSGSWLKNYLKNLNFCTTINKFESKITLKSFKIKHKNQTIRKK